MNFIRKIINSDLLTDIINILENMRHKNVEIVILPCEEGEQESFKIELTKNAKDLLNKYADLSYLPLEQSAWTEAVRE